MASHAPTFAQSSLVEALACTTGWPDPPAPLPRQSVVVLHIAWSQVGNLPPLTMCADVPDDGTQSHEHLKRNTITYYVYGLWPRLQHHKRPAVTSTAYPFSADSR